MKRSYKSLFWGKPFRQIALILCVAITFTLLFVTFAGKASAAPVVGPRVSSAADPVNGIYVSPTGNDATAY